MEADASLFLEVGRSGNIIIKRHFFMVWAKHLLYFGNSDRFFRLYRKWQRAHAVLRLPVTYHFLAAPLSVIKASFGIDPLSRGAIYLVEPEHTVLLPVVPTHLQGIFLYTGGENIIGIIIKNNLIKNKSIWYDCNLIIRQAPRTILLACNHMKNPCLLMISNSIHPSCIGISEHIQKRCCNIKAFPCISRPFGNQPPQPVIYSSVYYPAFML